VVKLHDLLGDVRLQGIVAVWEIGEGMLGHGDDRSSGEETSEDIEDGG
jgi:hypothetical protein